MAGYSGTPLAAKLGLKEGARILVVNAPAGYRKLLAPLPGGARILTCGTSVALPLGYVDIKVCAVSEIWSGLKLVVRKELR